jgi:hypothetical protein
MTFLRLAFLAALLALTSLFVSLAVNLAPASADYNSEPRVKCQAVGVCPPNPPSVSTPPPDVLTSSTVVVRHGNDHGVSMAAPVVALTPRVTG